MIAPHVKRVVITKPKSRCASSLSHAPKIKTDTISASVLAQLYASSFLPGDLQDTR